MYNVSDAVIEAYKADGVHKEYKVNINGIDYENDKIVDDSFCLKQSILDSEQFAAIGCIASSFSVDVRAQFPTKVRGGRVKVYINAGRTGWMQIFDGYVDKCTKTANGWNRHIEAYDFLYNMSGQSGQADENEKKKYDITDWYNNHASVQVSTLLSELCSKFGLSLRPGDTPLANGYVWTTCGHVKNASNLSALDLLKKIMEINACFGYITGDGYFSWRYLQMHSYDETGWLYPSGYLYPSTTIYPGQDEDQIQTKENATNFIGEYESLEYQDFKMLPINVVKVRNHENDETQGVCGSGENSYIIQGNPLFLDADKAMKDLLAKNIYDKLNSTWYVPFNANLPGLPYLQCGDEINFWDFVGDYGSASLNRFYIMNRTITGGQHLKDSFSAEGNEYLHEFISGEQDNSSVEEIREEVEERPTEEEVQEMIDNAGSIVNIVSVWPNEVPAGAVYNTLYVVRGEVVIVDSLEEPEPELGTEEENQNDT